jgi:hypothetical protein
MMRIIRRMATHLSTSGAMTHMLPLEVRLEARGIGRHS